MAKEWIEDLAQGIKEKDREAAQDYGRAQHYAGIVSTLGKKFFISLVLCLQENVDTLRSRLQGDPTSAGMALQTIKVDEVAITRERFPWVDARLTHSGETIALDYAKGPGVAGDAKLDRKTRRFAFLVAPDDSLYVEDAFADPARQYRQPEELARQITEMLFAA
jgi:hypothetical protein